MKDISRIIEVALAHNPQLSTRSFYDVQRWLAEGCDAERDIMPALLGTIQKFAQQGKPPLSNLRYIERPVYEARDRRKREEAATDPANADARRALHLALKRRFGQFVQTIDEAWLARYEGEHGPVQLSSGSSAKSSHERSECDR